VIILSGFLNEEVGKELRNLTSLLSMVSLNSEFKVILFGVELGTINGVFTTFNCGNEGISKIVLRMGNSVVESIESGIFDVSFILNAPVVIIIVRSFVLRVHLKVKGNTSEHS